MKVRSLLLSLLALLLLALGTLAWMSRNSFQKVSEKGPRFWTEAAQRNPYLLLEKWLQLQGFEVARKGGPLKAERLKGQNLLLLLHLSKELSNEEVDALLAWVRQGGHLVLDASTRPNPENPIPEKSGAAKLLNRLQVAYVPPPEDSEWEVQTDRFSDDDYALNIERDPEQRLVADHAQWQGWVGDEAGDYLLHRDEGQGHLTLCSQLHILKNEPLTELDHAAWFATFLEVRKGLALSDEGAKGVEASEPGLAPPPEGEKGSQTDVVSGPAPDTTWGARGERRGSEATGQSPSSTSGADAVPRRPTAESSPTGKSGLKALIWSEPVEENFIDWLFRNAWPMLLPLGLLLSLWIWRGAWRWGPIAAAPDGARRSLQEHLQASGRWMWRNQGGDWLLKVSREALKARATRRHPGFPNLKFDEQIAYLQTQSQLPLEDVIDAFQDRPGLDAQQIAHRISILQHLRSRLSK